MELKPGLQIFHCGIPVELLHVVEEKEKQQTWLVKPLFIVGPVRKEVFREHDKYSKLHTQHH